MDEKLLEYRREYLNRQEEISKTFRGTTRDYLMRCPECGSQDMEQGSVGWNCLWRDCLHRVTHDEVAEVDDLIVAEKLTEAFAKETEKKLGCKLDITPEMIAILRRYIK